MMIYNEMTIAPTESSHHMLANWLQLTQNMKNIPDQRKYEREGTAIRKIKAGVT